MEYKHLTEEEIIDYILGELTSKKIYHVESHLNVCQACLQEYRFWHKTLASEEESVPSQFLKQRVLADLPQKKHKKAGKFPYVAVSFCVVMLLMIGLFQWNEPTPSLQEDSYAIEDLEQIDALQELEKHELNNIQLSSKENILWIYDERLIRDYYEEILYKELFYMPETKPFQTVDQPIKEHVVFVTEDALCTYQIQERKIICIPLEMIQPRKKDRTTMLQQLNIE